MKESIIEKPKTIFLATGNSHKKAEFQTIFNDVNIIIPKEQGIEFNPDETGSTFFENAMIKARALYEITKQPVMADDSGLCVDALNGEPGIFSARYGFVNGKTSDEMNIVKLLSNMENAENRRAHFVCCLVVYFGNDKFFSVQQTCHGEILQEKRGEHGFGYDPVFFIAELNKTMAELSDAKKNEISHRGRACRDMKLLLNK
ncbi:MAG: non-canonical purine NTP pyrophosphatase, RdgB/HAM1 family [Treponema sp.]|nr:MAG: non-canonical purine NTP pyrophosphatase, RdgB/HAM1 family [Treponema sp.]